MLAVEHDGGGDARPAVGDELTVRQLRRGFVPRCVQRPGDPPWDAVDRIWLSVPAACEAPIDDNELVQAGRQRLPADRVVGPLDRYERRGLSLLVPSA